MLKLAYYASVIMFKVMSISILSNFFEIIYSINKPVTMCNISKSAHTGGNN